ncbi:MAG: hypothetical protein IKH57_00675 [Clostridia bacterium]|nr:hypothetical protein [Clostridia bacterium]MBR3107334.1 hypothetical protein [Clostridia bacterium]
MDDPNKKVKQEEIDKNEKAQITDDEAEKAAGGANFWFFDDETRKPKKGKSKGA